MFQEQDGNTLAVMYNWHCICTLVQVDLASVFSQKSPNDSTDRPIFSQLISDVWVRRSQYHDAFICYGLMPTVGAELL